MQNLKTTTDTHPPTCCPLCSQPWPVRDGLTFIGDYIFWQDRPLRLTPHQAQMFFYLYKKRGRYVSDESLFVHIYGMRGDDAPEPKILQVYATKIRAALVRVGAPFIISRQRAAHHDYNSGGYVLSEAKDGSKTSQHSETFRTRPRLHAV